MSPQHEPLTLYFIDYGHSERCEEEADFPSWESSTCSGTPQCAAPELLRLFDPDYVEADPALALKDVPRTFKLGPIDVRHYPWRSDIFMLTMSPDLRTRCRVRERDTGNKRIVHTGANYLLLVCALWQDLTFEMGGSLAEIPHRLVVTLP